MCNGVSPDACFNDVCTGEQSPEAFVSRVQQWQRIAEAYESTGNDALDQHNIERLADNLPPITEEQFSRPLRAATDTELESDTSVRTRYKKPGQGSGRGTVRHSSGRMKAFILRLMKERDTSALVRLPGSEDIDNIGWQGARDLIARLLACPELPDVKASRDRIRYATEKQWDWLRKLTDKDVTEDSHAFRTRAHALSEDSHAATTVPFSDASKALDVLFAAPRVRIDRTDKAARERIGEGMYRAPDGRIIRVQMNKEGTGVYAKLWELFDVPEPTRKGLKYGAFVYSSGLIREVKAEWRMTLAEAVAMGAEFHYCVRCGIELTADKSIEAGIGPICAGKI